ncbi:hypothetical protein C7447_10215 [Tenacibaculum adriaticum]|uniref:histidine kinase n=1 Tax=Tenacibaculum adriaticum TaxID=413713 RepID=A0A5S5DRZ8_9FLAO|nr:sensor histidine kinase [Tenacibaculum adriaticum]TYP98700.1 hypothetical protein C7447_10215 [Tenacibaculum adriaticum]
MLRKKINLFLLLFPVFLFSQEEIQEIKIKDSIGKLIKNREVSSALSLLNKLSENEFDSNNKYLVIDKNLYYCYYLKKSFDSCKLTLNKIKRYSNELNTDNLSDFYLNKGYYFKAINKLDSSAIYFTKSLEYYQEDNPKHLKNRINIYSGLAAIHRLTSNKEKQLFYLEKYLESSKKSGDSYKIGAALNNLGVYYDNEEKPETSLIYFKKSLKYKLRKKNRNSVLQNIGSIYLNHFNNIDSASYYNKKAINQNTSKRTLAYIHRDLSIIAKRKSNYLEENKELLSALKNIRQDNFAELEIKLLNDLSQNYKNQGNYRQAYNYLNKFNQLNDSLKKQSLIEKVEEIETKYQTEKKEKENLKLKQENLVSETKRKQNRNLLIGSFLFILLGGIIAILALKNSKRKQKLAEQETELETQKNLSLIKEQEINTINAMVNGQEKERKRIAEDLHDNLGSVLATLKLHFENLKLNREKKHFNQDELYEKTEKLIDETYLKVRSIAHVKNAGVIANQGLLSAIKMMSDKISSANKISIEVLDFGLNKRLENNIEIIVFRIVQELITNIIKHAEASNVSINLSQYDNNLNVIIEDNGKGFDINKINYNNGMGLGSIKTRVKHLKGDFDIDSTLGKGTSIIFNIPLT